MVSIHPARAPVPVSLPTSPRLTSAGHVPQSTTPGAYVGVAPPVLGTWLSQAVAGPAQVPSSPSATPAPVLTALDSPRKLRTLAPSVALDALDFPRAASLAASMPLGMPVMMTPRKVLKPPEVVQSPPLLPAAAALAPVAPASVRTLSPPAAVQSPPRRVVNASSTTFLASASAAAEASGPRHWGRASSPALERQQSGKAGSTTPGHCLAGSATPGHGLPDASPPASSTVGSATTASTAGCSSNPGAHGSSRRSKTPRQWAESTADLSEEATVRKERQRQLHEQEEKQQRKESERPPLWTELYEDAFARKERQRQLREQEEEKQERKERERRMTYKQGMQERKRFYRGSKDDRSHFEREQEMIRRRQEWDAKKEAEEEARKRQELRECTFRPDVRKGRTKSPSPSPAHHAPLTLVRSPSSFSATPISPRAASPRARGGTDMARLQQLATRQRAADEAFQGFQHEEELLQEHLKAKHAELFDRIQQEETQLVVSALQDSEKQTSEHQQLIKKAQAMVMEGYDPAAAQQMVVEELVARSQGAVQRRVGEAFKLVKQQLEGELYTRKLAVVHELEVVETLAVANHGMAATCEEAAALGLRFGLAEEARRCLTSPPPTSPAASPTRPHGSPGQLPASSSFQCPPEEALAKEEQADTPRASSSPMRASSSPVATICAVQEDEWCASPRDMRRVSFGNGQADGAKTVAEALVCQVPEGLEACRRRLQFD